MILDQKQASLPKLLLRLVHQPLVNDLALVVRGRIAQDHRVRRVLLELRLAGGTLVLRPWPVHRHHETERRHQAQEEPETNSNK